MKAHVAGLGFWAPGWADLAAWRAGSSDEAVTLPPCDVVDSRLKRGTSLLTRMSVEVAVQAARAGGLDPADVATVFGSVHGEMDIALFQMARIHDGEPFSPARFKNSVHNTAAGIYSIATGNPGFTTALAAGHGTVAMGLLEGMALLADGYPAVVIAFADETLPEPVHPVLPYASMAAAVALTADASGALATLGDLRPAGPAAEVPKAFAGNPVAPALALIEAIAAGRSGPVALSADPAAPWSVDLEPAS